MDLMAGKVALGLADDLLARTDHVDPGSALLLSVRNVRTVCLALRAEHDVAMELVSALRRTEARREVRP